MVKEVVSDLLGNIAYMNPNSLQDIRVVQLALSYNSSNLVDTNNVYVGRRATDGGLVLGYIYKALFPAIMSVDMRTVFVVNGIEEPTLNNMRVLFLGGKLQKGTSFEQLKN